MNERTKSKSGLITKLVAGAAVLGALVVPAGCTRSTPMSYNTSFNIQSKPYEVNKVTQRDNTYKASLVGIGNQGYFVVETPESVALFDYDAALRVALPSVNDKDNLSERIISGEVFDGERGVYELKPAKNKNDTDKSLVRISNRKANTQKFRDIKEKDSSWLSSKNITEKTNKYNLPTIELPRVGSCYIVESAENMESSVERYESGKFYNFYVIPVRDSQINTDAEGKITLVNRGNILIPTFVPYTNLKKQELENREREAKIREAIAKEKKNRGRLVTPETN